MNQPNEEKKIVGYLKWEFGTGSTNKMLYWRYANSQFWNPYYLHPFYINPPIKYKDRVKDHPVKNLTYGKPSQGYALAQVLLEVGYEYEGTNLQPSIEDDLDEVKREGQPLLNELLNGTETLPG